MSRTGYMVAEVRCDVRDDCMHIYSADLPGFHLAVKTTDHYDEADMCAAIEWYFKATRDWNIRAERAASPLQVIGQMARDGMCDVRRVVMTPEFALV